MHHQALLDKYSASVAETSRHELTAKMAKYLAWLGSRTPTPEEAQRWIGKMKKEGYADNTLKKEYETIRQLHKINSLPWEVSRGAAPRVNKENVWRPSLGTQAIKAMISVALQPNRVPRGLWRPDSRDICFLFLSTIWGLRRIEMARLQPSDINRQSSLIHIETAKHGRSRWHWVPPDVMHFITDWGFTYPASATTCSRIFNQWRLAVGLQTDQELGWHSIRRSLARHLIEAGVSPERRKQFMRWAMDMKEDMGETYGTAPVVDLDGASQRLVVDEQKNDEAVLGAHPFLPFWREAT